VGVRNGRNICDRYGSRAGAEIRPRQLTQQGPILLAAAELSNDRERFPRGVIRELSGAIFAASSLWKTKFFARFFKRDLWRG
jgi:hypothetical protein